MRKPNTLVILLLIVPLLLAPGCATESSAMSPVSEALQRDAKAYAEAHDVPLDEAIRRLRQQDPVGELSAVLREQEADVFGGLWIQHEPVYKVVVLVTRGQRRIERRYVRGGPLSDVAEVREAEWTLETLTAAQIEVMQILEAVGSRAQTGIDVRGNCVALYTTDPGSLLTTIDAAGLTMPEPVCIADTGPYAEAPPVEPPPGIIFPRQHPPEGLRVEMTALLIGELVEEDGCLRVEEGESSHLIIWPYDHTVTAAADGTLQIRDGSGAVVARVGDVMRMGGGETHSLDSVTPMEVPARCTGPYWIAGSQIEGVNLQELPDHPDIAPLLRALRTQGYALGEPEESQAAFLQPEPGIAYRLDEHSWLHLHLFPDEQAAQVRADSIPHEMSNSIVDWVAPPHFYRCGRVIALYLGANEDVEAVLDGSLRGTEHCQLIAGSVEIAVVDAAFSNAEAALSAYEHPPTEAGGVVEALNGDCAQWLSDGGEPEALEDALRRLPRLESADLAVTLTDLNGDGLSDVVVEPRFIGLAVLGCLASQDGAYICQPLPAPAAFGVNRLTMRSGILSRDLIGDGRPETVVTYTVQGGSGWRELLYVFRWPQPAWSEQVFRATLINWAGRSTWRLEQDPNSRQRSQIVLTYPQLYPIDHKMLNHPLGRQIWRWDGEVGQFALAERTVDLEQSAWGTEREITVEDRLRWLANEGETAFRYAEYEEALAGYGEALAFAEAQGWRPADDEPDWVGFLRFRRAQVLAYLGQIDAARSGMLRLTTDYEGDLLGELARAFLSGYGDGDEEEAAAEAHAALLRLEERVRDHFYHERQGALRFPIQGDHLLCCAPGTRVLTASDGWQQALDICVGGPSVAQETCDPTEIPTDVTAWDAHSLPHVDVTVPVPPGWVIRDRGEVGDTVYGVTFQPPVWDSPTECGYQCPEISAVIYRDPVTATASGVEAVRTWLERRATNEAFGADVDDSVEFFGVEQIEETTLNDGPAVGFHHESMGIRLYTVLTVVDGTVVGLSKSHVGQFEFEPVFEMMRTHTTVRETITDIP